MYLGLLVGRQAREGTKNAVIAVVCLALTILSQHLFVASFKFGTLKDEWHVNLNVGVPACVDAASSISAELLVGTVLLVVALLSVTLGRSLSRLNVYLRPVVILMAVGIVVWLGGAVYLLSGGLLISGSLLRFLEDVIQSMSGC